MVFQGLLLGGLVACAAAPPAVNVPTAKDEFTAKTAGTAASDSDKAKPVQVALPPNVAKPGEILVDAQWLNPQNSIDQLLTTSIKKEAGLTAEKFEKLKRNALKDVLRDLLGSRVRSAKELAKEVMTTAPFRAVLAVNVDSPSMPRPMVAFSIPLRSVQAALAAMTNPPKKVADGVWLVTKSENGWAKGHCGVLASRGASPARLICGERERDVTTLGPYVARNMAEKPLSGGELVATVNLRPLFERYGDSWKPVLKGLPAMLQKEAIGQPVFDSALVEAGEAVAQEVEHLLDEVHGARMTISFSKGIKASLAFSLKGQRSWLGQGIAAMEKMQGPAPAMFWRLPSNSSSASFSRTGDPARSKGIFQTVSAMAQGALIKVKVPKRERVLLTRLIRHPLTLPGSLVSASGSFAMDKSQPEAAQAIERLVGWNVMGLDQDAASLKKWLKDFVQTFNNGGLRRRLKKETKEDAGQFLKLKMGVAPRELGPGAMAISLTLPSKGQKVLNAELKKAPAEVRKSLTNLKLALHLLLAVDGKRTWIGVGVNKKKLAGFLAKIKKNGCLGTPEDCKAGRDKLASLGSLTAFKTGRYLSGSYSSFRPLVAMAKTAAKMVGKAAPSSGKKALREVVRMLNTLPNDAKTPILSQGTIRGGTLKAELNIPKPAVEDIQHVIAGAVKMILSHVPKRRLSVPPSPPMEPAATTK